MFRGQRNNEGESARGKLPEIGRSVDGLREALRAAALVEKLM